MASIQARALHDRQRHYDMRHHQSRVQWLQDDGATWADGSSIRKHDRLTLLTGSKQCLCMIQQHGMTTNSVDLNDVEYVAELDAFRANAG